MFFPSRIFIIIYYNYLVIILFCINYNFILMLLSIGQRQTWERFHHAWRSKRLSGGERCKPHLDRWRRDNPRTQKNCSQPTNEAWAECRAMLEHYAMQGGGRGYSTDWRLNASMLCPKKNYPRRIGSWRVLLGICQSKGLVFTDSETYKSSPFALL